LKIPKGIIWIRNRQTIHWPKDKEKRTNNDLQNTTQKTEYREIWTPLRTGDEHRCSGRISSSYSTSGTHRISLVTDPVISHDWTGKCLRQMVHIRGNLQHRYSVTVNQIIVPIEKRSKWWLQFSQYIGTFGSGDFFVSRNPWSRKSWQESQALEYRINREINHVVERGHLWMGYKQWIKWLKSDTNGWDVLFGDNKSRG